MNSRALRTLPLTLACLLASPLLLAQADAIPRTEFGHPDLQGTYTFRTITPCHRRSR